MELNVVVLFPFFFFFQVATKCKERFHEVVKEEIENEAVHHQKWQRAMERSFLRMDKEVTAWIQGAVDARADCRCELQQPECEAVGSTAVVAVVTPDKIIVANCGDSRAVLCRKGKPVPLSSDHKVYMYLILFWLAINDELSLGPLHLNDNNMKM